MRLLASALCVMLLAATVALRAHAAEEPPVPRDRLTRSGYQHVRGVGGPDSVNSALRRHDAVKESAFRVHGLQHTLDPYYAFKRRMKERYGLALGLDFNMLFEVASIDPDENYAAGGVFRLYGHWVLFGRDTPTTGEIVFRVEHRHNFGVATAPQDFGDQIGSLFRTANSFSNFGWGVTNLQWQQWFADGRFGVALGQVDLRDWVDTFDLSNWRTALLGAAVTYPTNPLPSAGLGGAVFSYFRECSTPYVAAGFSDANGHPDQLGFDTFFNTREYYSFLEVGWTPSFARKDHDNIRLTYWHQDARKEKGTSEGSGLSFSAAWKFQDRWAPFLRGGFAEGGVIPAKAALVGGLGIHRRSHDLLGAALGWARPEETGLRDQVTFETFYRLQVSKNVGLTPDFQLIFDPSNNPDEAFIGVFSLRLQLAF